MTYKISLEALGQLGPEGFARLVQSHIAVLSEYDAHAAIVRQHAANPDMPAEERWVSLAVPIAAPEVESAIRRTVREDGTTDFVADYEIVGPSLEQRKARLFEQVSVAERDAINAVVPPGKVRAFQFREIDIRNADQARYNDVIVKVQIEAAKVGKQTEAVDFEKFNADRRPLQETKFLEEQAARENKRQAIYRWAAQLHSDIEDLTLETIDAWEMTPFHG